MLSVNHYINLIFDELLGIDFISMNWLSYLHNPLWPLTVAADGFTNYFVVVYARAFIIIKTFRYFVQTPNKRPVEFPSSCTPMLSDSYFEIVVIITMVRSIDYFSAQFVFII